MGEKGVVESQSDMGEAAAGMAGRTQMANGDVIFIFQRLVKYIHTYI